ncbi:MULTISPECIES: hypothetical protein [Methanobacterium]|uniref:Uncharacterized protein n=1 Tax=Methanobacterium veterum TaxID=408577 RepID=A0A9E5A7P3_9EURY|nr:MULTISPECIES: hypothetical protein [Methanobacterium]MCZ3365392.1 hypothetical protein [Methanobacterium veterum]MCZ3373143.1 hypothetical protein [Methanobacterium veterum]
MKGLNALRLELEELKKNIEPEKLDESDLRIKSINYLFASATNDRPSIDKILEGLTDEEKAEVAIYEWPECDQYSDAMKNKDVKKAIEIIEPLPDYVQVKIIDNHYGTLKLSMFMERNEKSEYPYITPNEFKTIFKETKEYMDVQKVKEHFDMV